MDTDKLMRPRVAVDGMNDGKGELPLCEILTKTLVLCILLKGMRDGQQIHVRDLF